MDVEQNTNRKKHCWRVWRRKKGAKAHRAGSSQVYRCLQPELCEINVWKVGEHLVTYCYPHNKGKE